MRPANPDPVAALLQRLRKGRKTNQRGAFGQSASQRRAKVAAPATPPTEQP